MDTLNQPPTPEERNIAEICHPLVGDDWTQVCSRIPVDLEALARETKALQRRREVKSASDLLRLVLAYGICDWPFRLVAAWATIVGLACLSDVAVRKRIRNSRGRIIGDWLQQRRLALPCRPARVRLIDATTASQPGSKGTDWRLHASFDLNAFALDGIEITDASGGETLARHAAEAGEILVADQGLAHRRGMGTILAATASPVVRINWQNLPLEKADGQKFDLMGWLRAMPETEQTRGRPVWVSTLQGRFALRLITCRLPPEAVEEARRRLRRKARKKGRTPSQESLFAAGFILLATNLPAMTWPLEQVLALYRLRWQIELVFKRLKGILNFEGLRAKDPDVAQVYLLSKVLAALILEGWTTDLTADLADW